MPKIVRHHFLPRILEPNLELPAAKAPHGMLAIVISLDDIVHPVNDNSRIFRVIPPYQLEPKVAIETQVFFLQLIG
jgi:hypothetical protein